MKNKLVEKKFYNDTFLIEVSFLFGGDVDMLKDFMKARHGSDAKFYSWHKPYDLYGAENNTDALQFHIFTDIGNADIFYLWMAELNPSLFFHELYHTPGDIIETVGMKLSEDSEEAPAYLAGWMGKKISEAIGIKFPKNIR
jgi:hypothetical protein